MPNTRSHHRQTHERRRYQIDAQPIHPDFFYRKAEYGQLVFGYSATQLDEKIKEGEIPAPIPLSDTGRAVGWFARVILNWQAERQAKAAAKTAAAKVAPKAAQQST
jgi:predicted DNA-binding transcriptional regulator AlpA